MFILFIFNTIFIILICEYQLIISINNKMSLRNLQRSSSESNIRHKHCKYDCPQHNLFVLSLRSYPRPLSQTKTNILRSSLHNNNVKNSAQSNISKTYQQKYNNNQGKNISGRATDRLFDVYMNYHPSEQKECVDKVQKVQKVQTDRQKYNQIGTEKKLGAKYYGSNDRNINTKTVGSTNKIYENKTVGSDINQQTSRIKPFQITGQSKKSKIQKAKQIQDVLQPSKIKNKEQKSQKQSNSDNNTLQMVLLQQNVTKIEQIIDKFKNKNTDFIDEKHSLTFSPKLLADQKVQAVSPPKNKIQDEFQDQQISLISFSNRQSAIKNQQQEIQINEKSLYLGLEQQNLKDSHLPKHKHVQRKSQMENNIKNGLNYKMYRDEMMTGSNIKKTKKYTNQNKRKSNQR